jgi:hypothetical protein
MNQNKNNQWQCHKIKWNHYNSSKSVAPDTAEVGITGPKWRELKTAVIRKRSIYRANAEEEEEEVAPDEDGKETAL